MTHKKCSPGTVRICSLFAIALTLTVPASAEWKEKVLYSFQGAPDGAVPAGGVVFDKAGNLYGATDGGGSSSCDGPGQCGTVYQLTPPTQKGGAWTETVLYIFKGHAQNDGATPEGGLLIDEAGNLYGTTGYGGSGPCTLLGGAVGCGTVYELSPPAKQGDPWTETVLYSFQGGKDGYVASGDLVFDKAGSLYGATLFGGGKGTTCDSLYGGQCGTVFKLSPPKAKGGKWTEKVLHAFASGTDGANPNGGLALDSKSNIYGTSFGGGNEGGECGSGGCGTAFELKPPTQKGSAWPEKVIYRFGVQDGATPEAGFVFGGNGHLYGTAFAGGISGNGAVFDLAPPKGGRGPWNETMLHRFSGGNDGENPIAGVTLDLNGNVYGVTGYGNVFSGTVFRLKPPAFRGGAWTLGIVYGFRNSPDGAHPASRLIFGNNGKIYGTTQGGGTGTSCSGYCGTVFEVWP
jgi:hypothetical protein